MILQEEFAKCGYQDILVEDRASEYGINLDDIYNTKQKPKELLGIYISQQRDELFFLINGDANDINTICNYWDNQIRVFTIIYDKTAIIKKLKYNIVQLIVCSNEILDRKMEGNLLVSRKIIINGNLLDKSKIIIDDDESIELPFHMIFTDTFEIDVDKQKRLEQLLPQEKEVEKILKKPMKRKNETWKNNVTIKSLNINDYECIKEWLDDDNT